MTIPIHEPLPTEVPVSGDNLSRQEVREAVIRAEVQALSQELPDLDKYRSYYEGDQQLVFGTQEFRDKFGPAYANYRDNWCEVVADAVVDKLTVQGILVPGREEDGKKIWEVFKKNDYDEVQNEVHEAAIVEGKATVIVWKDPELGVRLDFNPPQMVRVRYSDDDYRRAIFAIKQWITPSGETRVNVYTTKAVYKYTQRVSAQPVPPNYARRGVDALRAPDNPSASLTPRRVEGEPWPLPHSFGRVPVVEFVNKTSSELKNVIPHQDAINYIWISAFTAGEFSAWAQRVFFTAANEPPGGWKNSPGMIWRVPVIVDAEGKPLPSSMGEFRPANLDGFRQLIETQLQSMAHTSKTPVRLFFKSDRGGRGDAPSGESLIVEDEPLLEKVANRQSRFGNSWYRVAGLIAKGLGLADLPPGEMRWKDTRAKYRTTLLTEAKVMFDMGVPLDFLVEHMAFSPEEIEILRQKIEVDVKKKEEEAAKEMENQVTLAKETASAKAAATPKPSTPARPAARPS